MARSAETRKARFAALLAERRPNVLDEAFADEARRALAPVSESWLRRLFRDSGLPMTPMVEGVSLHSLADLRRTLLALAQLYESAPDAERRLKIRALVVEAKVKARFLRMRSSQTAEREEMAAEILTWLENPLIFGEWVRLRERALSHTVRE